MKAERVFRELGFSIIGNYEKLIIYQRKTDFEEVTIWFHKKDFLSRTYDIRYMDWIEHKSDDWIPMEDRKESFKHVARYGHWQKGDYPMSMELHKAIHQQCEELGWLDD